MKAVRESLVVLAITCVALLSLASCATPSYRTYTGGQRPPQEIAVLLQRYHFWKDVHIEAIDGVRLSDSVVREDGQPLRENEQAGNAWDRSFRLELLPGSHTISVYLVSVPYGNLMGAHPTTTIPFAAEAGKTYEVICDVAKTSSQQLDPYHTQIGFVWGAHVEEVK